MNSDHIPDDEIDNLFREYASRMHNDFDPLAWKEMEIRLDERIVRRASRKKIYLLLALLLLVGTGLWIYQLFYARNEDHQRISATIQPALVSPAPGMANDKKMQIGPNMIP